MNEQTLNSALENIASRSFYEGAEVRPNGDGTYTVTDDSSMNADDWRWTYHDGVLDTDSVSEVTRLMDSAETFTCADHIRYNMPNATEALEQGRVVTFAYAVVGINYCACDNDCDCDNYCYCDPAGWILTADIHGHWTEYL